MVPNFLIDYILIKFFHVYKSDKKDATLFKKIIYKIQKENFH